MYTLIQAPDLKQLIEEEYHHKKNSEDGSTGSSDGGVFIWLFGIPYSIMLVFNLWDKRRFLEKSIQFRFLSSNWLFVITVISIYRVLF